MKEKSKLIFGNEMTDKVYRKAVRTKKKNIKKFGDDRNCSYPVNLRKNEHIGDQLGVVDVQILKEGEKKEQCEEFDREKGIIVGNIRMGFGNP